MATYSVATGEISSGTVTMAANTEDTVTFNDVVREVEVLGVDANPSGVYFTLDGTPATIDGKRCHYLPPGLGVGVTVPARFRNTGNTTVRLISAGVAKVRVTDADEN